MMLGMEDVSSECSSGCQSGWTMYLDHSSYSGQNHGMEMEAEEEEEDLSMLSDASSGPSPLFHGEVDLHETPALFYTRDCSNKGRVQKEKQRNLAPNSYLDDTASSPFYDHKFNNGAMNAMVDFSSSFSTTQFKEKSVYNSRLCYFQSSPVVKPIPQRPVCKESGKKKMR
ncbi:hypothetical protein LUZ62_047033 [Rhynchospora pubera]|uniref:Uncharacterized protein n=1 Tax=Rhynchospora pubera TaxID=906938 RepID=A0AAV8FRA2_9POAL|nr:hypothetical protein LUZ62_085661 [Rhynchospora pubera]KAJ4766894.1 hypothetical protein LUZ62_077269 [Rhynchospora pubera]KAJ4795787.1 hypothetical protein LUZ62_047033 [Rhynchospora pubera]